MNWIDFTVCLCVSIALLGVLFYKLYPVIFKNKKMVYHIGNTFCKIFKTKYFRYEACL